MIKTALLDACVLFPAPLRDFWMNLIVSKTFEARWTEQIHGEWIRNALKRRPELSPEKLERARQLMNLHAKNAVVTGYETLIPSIVLPDENDRHVVAAAMHGEAGWIVTFNLKDFPPKTLHPLGLEAIHPDDFAVRLFQNYPENCIQGVAAQRANLQNPPKSVDDFLATLNNQGLTQTVRLLETVKNHL